MKAFSAKVVAALILLASWVTPASLAQTAAAGSDAPPPPPDASAARLIEAVRSGDRPLFAKILGEQPDIVNRRAAGGSTPLIYAALYVDANAVAMLLDRGANPNLANEAGATALMCGVGDEQITRQLLDHGADANAASRRGQTPLSIAAGRAGSRRVVGLLLDYGASPSPIPPAGTAQPANPLGTALVQVANAGDEEVFRLLVERGADVKAAGAAGLMLAARANCAACVDMLIGSVAPAALSSALVGLAPFGDTALLTRLIDRGADVNVRLPTCGLTCGTEPR